MLHPGMRRSGRTERMLRDAAADINAGKSVFILAAHEANQLDLASRLREKLHCVMYTARRGLEGEVRGGGKWLIVLIGSDWMSLSDGKVRGKDAVAYADHCAIEARYGWLLEEWLRYSIPSLVNPFAEEGM